MRKLVLALLVVIVNFSFGAGPIALSQSKQIASVPVEEALTSRNFGQLMPTALSPDGRRLAYTVQDNGRKQDFGWETMARTGVPPWGTGTDVYVLDVQSNETRNLTNGVGDNWLPTWSPDGRSLAFLSARNAHQPRLWVWSIESNELKEISNVNVRSNQIEWTQDSRKIVVTTLPEGLSVEDYLRISVSPEEVKEPLKQNVSGLSVTLYKSAPASPQHAASSQPFNLNRNLRDLTVVDISAGRTVAIVHRKILATYLLSPDGSYVAYTTEKRFERAGSQQILFDLATVNILTNQEKVLASDTHFESSGSAFSWSPDGKRLSFRRGGPDEATYDCYVAGLDGGIPRNISAFPESKRRLPESSTRPLWDKLGKSIYFVRAGSVWRVSPDKSERIENLQIADRRIVKIVSQSANLIWSPDDGKSIIVVTHNDAEKQDGVFRIDLRTGKFAKLLENGQCYTCANVEQAFAITGDGLQVAYFAEDAQNDQDLWMSDSGFQNPRRVTRLNPNWARYEMGKPQLVQWLSSDGELLRGALLLPSGYERGKRYPLIVWVYGGSSLSDQYNHFGLGYGGPFNFQLFATRGYAVLLPDAPLHLGTPMLDMAKTVLPGVDKVVELGIADPSRLGVMGHSFGGYSTLSLIVQTKRFRAAIEVDGYGDLLGQYGAMDKSGAAFGTSVVENGRGSMGATPWQVREKYVENSPVYYLDRVETPLLIVHGANDTTVFPFLGDELFVCLRRLGKEVEYAKYEGEGHVPSYWSYANQVDFSNRMIAWFDDHLKKPADKKSLLNE